MVINFTTQSSRLSCLCSSSPLVVGVATVHRHPWLWEWLQFIVTPGCGSGNSSSSPWLWEWQQFIVTPGCGGGNSSSSSLAVGVATVHRHPWLWEWQQFIVTPGCGSGNSSSSPLAVGVATELLFLLLVYTAVMTMFFQPCVLF